jgi:phosphoribosylanthranilate isomerase
VFVKICGITRVEDAHAAVAAGAQAVGFIFWPGSPRFVDPYRARAIVRMLPPFVSAIGVFVNQPADHVASVASLAHLSAVQLHGDESVTEATRVGRPVVKALTLAAADETGLAQWPSNITILLDVHDREQYGGTGRTIDWEAAAKVACRRQVILAGGINPGNVAEAVARVRPFGIDVSSGVESAPGRKDHAKIHALFAAIRGMAVSGS